MRLTRFVALVVLALLPCAQPATAEQPATTAEPSPVRPANWAQPVTVAGAPNLNRVTANFYRSAQPTVASRTSAGSWASVTEQLP